LPWWKRPWLQWPRAFQAFSVAVWVSMVAAVYLLRANLVSLFHASVAGWPGVPHYFQECLTAAQALWSVLDKCIASLRSPWLTIAVGAMVALYLGVLGVGAACYRLVAARPLATE
jgi:hypothetical protein